VTSRSGPPDASSGGSHAIADGADGNDLNMILTMDMFENVLASAAAVAVAAAAAAASGGTDADGLESGGAKKAASSADDEDDDDEEEKEDEARFSAISTPVTTFSFSYPSTPEPIVQKDEKLGTAFIVYLARSH
jgi:hypothetical protein